MEEIKDTKVLEFMGKVQEAVEAVGVEDKPLVKEQEKSKISLNGKVTRKEFIEVLKQITENMNQMTQFTMDDMNHMYADFFKYTIKTAVLEDILIDKLGVTSEEILDKYNAKVIEMQKNALKIKEMQEAKDKDMGPEVDAEGPEQITEDVVINAKGKEQEFKQVDGLTTEH